MTATATPLPIIDVDALRVGMFVHLDLGWMSHPFPLSSFRLASAQQIETLRTLGLQQVRWDPQRSEAPKPPAPPAAAAPPSSAAAAVAARRARDAAAADRAALGRCERQFAEAAKALRETVELSARDPRRAGAQAAALSRAIVDKMLGARELNVRLLGEVAGERAATHGLNVAIVALLLGRAFGLSGEELVELGTGALLHDIGKRELPDRLRHREPHFSAAETEAWRQHVPRGVEQGRRMALAPGALRVIAEHHEQADGQGFPQRLTADATSAGARLVALVDRYDNLCNPPLPARALTPHEALSTMFAQHQRQFDPTLLSALIRMIGIYPPGSVVQLTDERFAIVVSVNSTRPLKPRVQVHDPRDPEAGPPLLDLEQVPGLGIRRSLKPMQLPPEALQQLAPRSRCLYFFEAAREAAEDAP